MNPYKRGQYMCPMCGCKFVWGYGILEKIPEFKDEDLVKQVCPPCSGLDFHDPLEILRATSPKSEDQG